MTGDKGRLILKSYLGPEEVSLLEKNTRCLRDRLLVRILYRTGCRVSEALGLEVEDIDFGRGEILIQHLKKRIRILCPGCRTRLRRDANFCPHCGSEVKSTVQEATERRRVRRIPVDDDTLRMLKDFIRKDRTKGPIFRISRVMAFNVVRSAAQKAGLSRLINEETGRVHWVSPHRLRDAFATHAIKIDDSMDGVRRLQEHLGHASISTTMKYRKVTSREQRQWFDRLWEEKTLKNSDQA